MAALTPAPERPAWVSIDLGRFERNLGALRRRFDGAAMLAVVKADAYGHGAVPIAERAIRLGCEILGLARLEEAIELRRMGIESELLVLGPSRSEEVEAYRDWRVLPTLSSLQQVRSWSERAVEEGGPATDVHLKVDTGMGRLGVPFDGVSEALRLLRGSGLRLAGICSHLADTADPTSARNQSQIELFELASALLTAEERQRAQHHLAASAAGLHLAGARYELVRTGLALYGYDPSGRETALEPVLELRARLIDLREAEAGTRVGYDGIWVANRPSRLGILPVGYGDGYPRALSNRGEVLVRGRRAPVVGAVSMDLTVVDLTDIPAEVGDECVLLGREGEESIGADELAQRTDTISYEVLCRLGTMRLERRYRG